MLIAACSAFSSAKTSWIRLADVVQQHCHSSDSRCSKTGQRLNACKQLPGMTSSQYGAGAGRKARVAPGGHSGRRAAHAGPRGGAQRRVPGLPAEGAAAAGAHLADGLHGGGRARRCVLSRLYCTEMPTGMPATRTLQTDIHSKTISYAQHGLIVSLERRLQVDKWCNTVHLRMPQSRDRLAAGCAQAPSTESPCPGAGRGPCG